METIIDSHCHIFNTNYLPETFERRYTANLNPRFLKGLLKIFTWMDRDTILYRAENLLKIGFSESILEVAAKLIIQSNSKHLDRNVIFTPLTMDLYYGLDPAKRTTADNNFHDQIEETKNVVLKYPGNFLPFIAAHPERIRKEGSQYIYTMPLKIKVFGA